MTVGSRDMDNAELINVSERASWLRLRHNNSQSLIRTLKRRDYNIHNYQSETMKVMLTFCYKTTTLIIILLHLTPSLVCEAHSNINTVWLSKDDQMGETSNNKQHSVIKYHIKTSSPLESSAISTTNQDQTNQLSYRSMPDTSIIRQLQASSSSLQPAIVSLDQESERRSDTDSGSPPLSFAPGNSLDYAGISARSSPPQVGITFNNEASSLDSLWSVNQTNAQVQFDEEHQQAQQSSSSSSSQEQINRRQDNETSTLAPKHEIPAPVSKGDLDPASDANQINDDLHIGQELDLTNGSGKANSSQQAGGYFVGNSESTRPALDVHILSAASYSNDSQTQHQLQSTPNNQSSSTIYYMPDGYKWYPTGGSSNNETQVSGGRRKLHNSGTQYDLRGSDNRLAQNTKSTSVPHLLSGGQANPTNDHHTGVMQDSSVESMGSDASRVQAGDGLAHEFYQISNYAQQNKLQQHQQQQQQHQRQNPLAYGFVPPEDQQQSIRFIKTTQAPAQQHAQRFTQQANRFYKPLPILPAQFSNNLFLNHRQQPQFSYAPAQNYQTIVRPRLVPRPPRYPNNFLQYQQQQQLQPLNQWPVGSRRDTTGWRTQRPLIGPITANRLRHPHENSKRKNNQRPSHKPVTKKSLLGAIGSRLTSWVEPITSPSNSNGHRAKDPEESFYETSNSKRSPITGAQWNAANFYLIDATQHEPAMLTNLVHPPSPLHHRGALTYYPYTSPNHQQIRQPTVAPAPSSLDKFYQGAATPGVHNPLQALDPEMYLRSTRRRRYPTVRVQADSSGIRQQKTPVVGIDPTGVVQQQPASFIPVVAVSVTKTSPAPRPASEHASMQGDKSDSERANSELYDYLELKTGNKNQASEDYGNMASGSVNRDLGINGMQSYQVKALPTQRPAHLPNDPQLTTTVKSAIFGYLPHEANKPLMDALNAVPHYATRTQLANEALNGQPPLTLADMDRNPLLQHAAAGSHDLTMLDEQPSLALQLQANNFAQNDIAHPFALPSQQLKASTVGRSSVGQAGQTALRGLPMSAVYPTNQAQYHGFQFFQPSDSAQHPQILSAAATELNPLLMPIMFANPGQQQAASFGSPKSQYALMSQPGAVSIGGTSANQDQQDADDQSASSSMSNANVAADADSDSSSDSDANQSLNKGNKKRSSEFFASAGQLLLSALPLLLAPTLGLMFASSPLPVARYHAPTDSFGGGPNSFQSGIPGNYLSSLNQGQVMNSSPVQLFTPSPPIAQYNQSNPNNSTLAGSTTTAKPIVPIASPSQPTSTSVAAPNTTSKPQISSGYQRLASSQTNILRSSGPGTNNRSGTGPGTYGPQRITLTLTTPSYGNESDLLDTENDTLEPKGPHHSTNTLVLMTHDNDDQNESLGGNQTVHYIGHGHVGGNEQSAGYDGVDFDAQFPSLRKSSSSNNLKLFNQNQQQRPQQQQGFANNSRAQDELIARKPSQVQNKDSPMPVNAVDQQDPLDVTAGNRLYPVSTWPPMRRKTVSLVTSNGNKTLLDASEKYQNIDYYSDGPAKLKTQPLAAGPVHRTTIAKNQTLSETSYAETNFDDSEGGDDVVAAPVKHSLSKNQPDLVQQHQPPVHRTDNAPMDFLFSNGLATVSLTSEPLIARRAARSKREASGSNSVVSTRAPRKRLIKKVRRLVHLRRDPSPEKPAPATPVAQDQTQAGSNSSHQFVDLPEVTTPSTTTESLQLTNSTEILRVGASSGKSAHVIAAMVAHLDNEEEEAAARRRRANRDRDWTTANDDYQPISNPGDLNERPDTLSNGELRELLLRKKAALERVNNANQTDETLRDRPPNDQILDSDYETGNPKQTDTQTSSNKFNSRPVEVTSTRFRLSANGTAVKSKQRAEQPISQRRLNGTGAVELNEDTKKALANIGSVLIREGLNIGDNEPVLQDGQIERPTKQRRQTKRSRQRHGSSDENWRRRRFKRPEIQQVTEEQVDEELGLAATERSLLRATPTSLQNSDDDSALGLDEELDSVSLDARDALIDRPGRRASESVSAYQTVAAAHGRGRRLPASRGTNGGGDGSHRSPSLFIRDDDLAEMRRLHNRSRGNHGTIVRDRVSLFEGGSGRPNAFGASDDRPDLHDDEYHSGRHSNTALVDYSIQHQNKSSSDWNYYNSEPSNTNNVGFYPASRVDGPFHRSSSNNTDRRAFDQSSVASFGNEHQPAYYPAGYSQVQRQAGSNHYPYDNNRPYQQEPYNQYGHHQPNTQYSPPSGYSNQAGGDYDPYHQQHNASAGSPQLFVPPAYLPQRTTPGPSPYRSQPSNDYPMVSSNGYNSQNYSPLYSQQQLPPPLPPQHRPAYNQYTNPAQQDNYSRAKFYPQATKYTWPPMNHQADQSQAMNYYPTSQPTPQPIVGGLLHQSGPLALMSDRSHDRSDSRTVNEYLKRVQFSDSDRDKLMASYLTCDGLLNDNDHCLERLSCEFSDPQNIEKANKLDRAVSSILLGHILINTYIPNQFKLRLKSASLFGYTQSGKCNRYVCNKLTRGTPPPRDN